MTALYGKRRRDATPPWSFLSLSLRVASTSSLSRYSDKRKSDRPELTTTLIIGRSNDS